MIQITAHMRVLVAIEPVDGRKGIDSLAQLCREKLLEDPFSGCVVIFRSRSGTAIRLLTYDGQGYWLVQKRLSKGVFSLVAGSRPTRQETGSLRSTTSARGRRCVASARRTDVEAGGWTKLGNPEVGEGPCVPKRVAAYSRTNGGA